MTPEHRTVCEFGLTWPDNPDGGVLACPQCGYCVEVPPPWNREATDSDTVLATVRPPRQFVSFAEERRSTLRKYLLVACLGFSLGFGALCLSFSEQQLFWRLLSAVGAFGFLTSASVLLGAWYLGQKAEGPASVVPIPEKPRSFYELGRPICVVQEASSKNAVTVAVVVEVTFALTALVASVAAGLAIREGIIGTKILLLTFMAPVLAGLLLYHAWRLVYFPLRVWLFEGGMARVRGDDIAVQPWESIADVAIECTSVYGTKHVTLTIEGSNGRRLEFGKGIMDLSSRDIERLANAVQVSRSMIEAEPPAASPIGMT